MTFASPALLTGEVPLDDANELLYRQVTTHTWDEVNRQPSLLAFGPAPVDKGMASYSRSSKVTVKQSRDWHNANAKSASMGVWALTVGEFDEEGVSTVDDSATPGAKAPGHCYADYRPFDKTRVRELRALLLLKALARGEMLSK